jgi:hypothetical protein
LAKTIWGGEYKMFRLSGENLPGIAQFSTNLLHENEIENENG